VFLDADPFLADAVHVDPDIVLEGETPRLLDEWQLQPLLWNLVRHRVDARPGKGQFILTGSARPTDDLRRHSGAGRFSVLRMRPMCLYESGHASGHASLSALMDGTGMPSLATETTIQEIAELVARGGWPAQQSAPLAAATEAANDYLLQIQEVDVAETSSSRRDPAKIGRLLRSIARNLATPPP